MKYIKTFEKLNDDDTDLVKLINAVTSINVESINAVERLIKKGINLNAIDEYGDTALIHASYGNRINKCKLLINAGANLDIQNIHRNTALILAAVNKYINFIKLLIDGGADWNIKNEGGRDFLDILPEKEKMEIIELYPEKYKEYLIIKKSQKYNL